MIVIYIGWLAKMENLVLNLLKDPRLWLY